MKCFYHPDSDSVGICQQCGKSSCRNCIEDVGGAMLCKGCLARERAAQEKVVAQREQEHLAEIAVTRAKAAKRIRRSWIIAIAAAVFYGLMALAFSQSNTPPAVPGLVLFVGGTYLLWSVYWGLVWFWPKWREFVRRFKDALSGWILIARPFTWFMLFMFYFVFYLSVPLGIAVYYGPFGGGIYQYLKHRRIASGKETEGLIAANEVSF
jgi:hypothetical protein